MIPVTVLSFCLRQGLPLTLVTWAWTLQAAIPVASLHTKRLTPAILIHIERTASYPREGMSMTLLGTKAKSVLPIAAQLSPCQRYGPLCRSQGRSGGKTSRWNVTGIGGMRKASSLPQASRSAPTLTPTSPVLAKHRLITLAVIGTVSVIRVDVMIFHLSTACRMTCRAVTTPAAKVAATKINIVVVQEPMLSLSKSGLQVVLR